MSTDPDTILLESEEAMSKAVDYLRQELRGIRTGRASTALIDFLKVDYYGTPTDLKNLAVVNVAEATQLIVKPFDAGSIGEIKKAIESSGLGLNPISEGKQLRISVPPLSGERRQQLVAKVKKMGEEQKIALRNIRRDANKHADGLAKQPGSHFSEDEIETLKNEIQELLKKYEGEVDRRLEEKTKEIMEV